MWVIHKNVCKVVKVLENILKINKFMDIIKFIVKYVHLNAIIARLKINVINVKIIIFFLKNKY